MKKPRILSFVMCLTAGLIMRSSTVVGGNAVPLELPRPDQGPVAKGKPVKVYILSGQSNMVGFGALQGGAPKYERIYLSADPQIMPCRFYFGPYALLPHRIWRESTGDAQGAMGYLYAGGYDKTTDYGKMKPVKRAAVALGTTAEELPSLDGPHTLIVKGYVEVPMSGIHMIHAGYGESAYAVVALDGVEVYRKDPGAEPVVGKVDLKEGKRYPLTVTYLKGESGPTARPKSAAFWMKQVDLKGQGSLMSTIRDKGLYRCLLDDEGNWTVRNDVTYWETRISKEELGSGGPLSATSNGKTIGPEVPFGFVMGTFHDEPVLIIEASQGNRSLCWDYRPPSSGRLEPDNNNEGYEYRLLVEGVHKALANIDKIVPGYAGQGYEVVGFGWFQGHKDAGKSKEEYEENLVNLIQDLRKEFKAPDMRAVVATVGFEGWRLSEKYQGVHSAQMAVGDPKQHPEFAGKVASVDTRDFYRVAGLSPSTKGYHYNHNAEMYLLTGDAMGRAMADLLGGQVEHRPRPPRTGDYLTKPLAEMTLGEVVKLVYSDGFVATWMRADREPTAEDFDRFGSALQPFILDDLLPSFVASLPTSKAYQGGKLSVKSVLAGKGPRCNSGNGSIATEMDTIIEHYNAAGIYDYDWKPFGPDMRTGLWHYTSFSQPDNPPKTPSGRNRELDHPAGAEHWLSPEFDPARVGWKTGQSPFGQWNDKLEPMRPDWPACTVDECGCTVKPATLWEEEVLLMRQTFKVPPLREGHIYRFVVGGSRHRRSGEGYTIYINGKPLAEARDGYYARGVFLPRGGYVSSDFYPAFKPGKVTVEIKAFLRYTHNKNGTMLGPDKPVPHRGHMSVWMEEAKLPTSLSDLLQGLQEGEAPQAETP